MLSSGIFHYFAMCLTWHCNALMWIYLLLFILKNCSYKFQITVILNTIFPNKTSACKPCQARPDIRHCFPWLFLGSPFGHCSGLWRAPHSHTARQLQPCQPRATRTLMGFNVCNDPRHRCWVSNSQSHITFAHLQMIMPSLLQAYQIRNKTAFLCRQYITNTSVKLFPAEPYVYPFAHL